MTPRRLLWIVLATIWVLFFGWYGSFEGPLTHDEIEAYMTVARERSPEGERLDLLREFLESDTGDDFVIVNAVDLKEVPGSVEGMPEGASAQEILGEYMSYMWPALISRASHPVLMGRAAANAVDTWGIEGAEEWDMAGMMRYRSRRDMMEIVVNPEFADSHVYKIAAMTKTIAFPLDPWFHFGDPRLLLALIMSVLGFVVERWLPAGPRSAA